MSRQLALGSIAILLLAACRSAPADPAPAAAQPIPVAAPADAIPAPVPDGLLGAPWVEPGGRFGLRLPTGARQAENDPASGGPLFHTPDATFMILFHPLESPGAGLAELMAATEQGMTDAYPVLQSLSRTPVKAGSAPGELAVFEAGAEQAGQRPFCGCVVIEAGGVCLAGSVRTDGEAAVQALVASLATIQGLPAAGRD
jgi:hypothetical protein